MSVRKSLEFVKVQRSAWLVLALALSGFSTASSAFGDDDRGLQVPNSIWIAKISETLPQVQVQISYQPHPSYALSLPNGQSFTLPESTRTLNLNGFSRAEIEEAAEDTREIVQAVARLLYSRKPFVEAEVRGDQVSTLAMDPVALAQKGVTEFDPIRAAYDDTVLNAPVVEVLKPTARERLQAARESATAMGHESLRLAREGLRATKAGAQLIARAPFSQDSRVELRETSTTRFLAVISFIKDAVWESTIRAYWTHQIIKVRNQKTRGNAIENGMQFVLRGEIQFGAGKHAIMKTLPLVLSIGYNKEKRTIAIRRGIRKEAMDGGSAFSLALKLEVKWYRLTADVVDSGDPREGWGSYRGESWMPPAPPIVSLVSDSGRGFQSWGLSFAFNGADVIPGSWLMNTVNSFEETQRVKYYSAPLPDPAQWMRKFHRQVDESAHIFDSAFTRGGRCEVLFKPSRAVR